MAVVMRGAVTLPADRHTVWVKLNDPAVLKSCLNGLHAMERTGDTTFAATVKLTLGPLSATLKGRIELTAVDAPHVFRIDGEGRGGLAGFARGGADVRLDEVPAGTLLRYDVQATVGGRIGQMGARLIDGVAQRTAARFFASFAAEVRKAGRPSVGQLGVDREALLGRAKALASRPD